MSDVENAFPLFKECVEEVSVEASPDSLIVEKNSLGDLVSAGVTRVSVGVQSLSPQELKRAGRSVAGPDIIWESLAALRAAGVKNIGVDVIAGLEGQSLRSFEASIEAILDFRPDTVSVYAINPRNSTHYGAKIDLGLETRISIYNKLTYASSSLRSAGYVRESSVQFKIAGRGGLKQKQLYFGGVPILGLGSGARSYTATVDYVCGGGTQRSRDELADHMRSTQFEPVARAGVRLSPSEVERRGVILGLQKLPYALVPKAGNGEFAEPYKSVFATCIEMGLMESCNDILSLTERGWLYRDLVCWALFSDTTLMRHSENGSDFIAPQRFFEEING